VPDMQRCVTLVLYGRARFQSRDPVHVCPCLAIISTRIVAIIPLRTSPNVSRQRTWQRIGKYWEGGRNRNESQMRTSRDGRGEISLSDGRRTVFLSWPRRTWLAYR